jgi:uncharacterized protein
VFGKVSSMSNAEPVQTSERILTLDLIRGVALLGIFIMNIPYMSMSVFEGIDGTHAFPMWWDRTAETLRNVLFSGKFNSMFSLLFGIGFTIQLGRLLEQRGAGAIATYVRRLLALLAFGVIHSCVFWTGDVLHVYAVLGFGLLLLRKASDRFIVGLIIAMVLFPAVTGVIRLATFEPENMERMGDVYAGWVASNNAAYGHGSFVDAAREHTREMVFLYTDPPSAYFMLSFYVQMATTLLLGFLLGRHNVFQNIDHYLPLVHRLQWWALGIGIVCGAIYGVGLLQAEPLKPTLLDVVASLAYVLCRVALMTFYVTSLIRLIHNTDWRPRLSPIATVGRMPLTNYLLQTLMGTFIFFGWGLGLWGKVGPALHLLLAVVLYFAIQIPLSMWWLKRFRYGPMEYFWRMLTYGRRALSGHEAAPATTTAAQ